MSRKYKADTVLISCTLCTDHRVLPNAKFTLHQSEWMQASQGEAADRKRLCQCHTRSSLEDWDQVLSELVVRDVVETVETSYGKPSITCIATNGHVNKWGMKIWHQITMFLLLIISRKFISPGICYKQTRTCVAQHGASFRTLSLPFLSGQANRLSGRRTTTWSCCANGMTSETFTWSPLTIQEKTS